jgi:hypothetical protein
MEMTRTIWDENADDVEVTLPAVFEVCPLCQGHGTIVNPSIGAITATEWDRDWHPDERDDYFKGMYDVTCPSCNGQNVVIVPDEEHINECNDESLKADFEAYNAHLRDRHESRLEHEYERRHGM